MGKKEVPGLLCMGEGNLKSPNKTLPGTPWSGCCIEMWLTNPFGQGCHQAAASHLPVPSSIAGPFLPQHTGPGSWLGIFSCNPFREPLRPLGPLIPQRVHACDFLSLQAWCRGKRVRIFANCSISQLRQVYVCLWAKRKTFPSFSSTVLFENKGLMTAA